MLDKRLWHDDHRPQQAMRERPVLGVNHDASPTAESGQSRGRRFGFADVANISQQLQSVDDLPGLGDLADPATRPEPPAEMAEHSIEPFAHGRRILERRDRVQMVGHEGGRKGSGQRIPQTIPDPRPRLEVAQRPLRRMDARHDVEHSAAVDPHTS